jgi:hypothetical protein
MPIVNAGNLNFIVPKLTIIPSRTYFNEHFKLRSELSFNKTELQHFGKYVDPKKTSLDAQQLRAMSGSTSVANFGCN